MKRTARLRLDGVSVIPAAVVETLDRRLLLSGQADLTWNGGERVELAVSGPPGTLKAISNRGNGTSLVLTAAVGGQNDLSGPGGLRVLRLTSGGSLDSGFGGGDGVVEFNLEGGVRPVSLLDLGPGSGFFVAGTVFETVWGSGGGQSSGNFILLRFDDDGALVPTFGGAGFRVYDLDQSDGDDRLLAMVRDPSAQRLVLAGTTTPLTSGTTRHAFLRVDFSGNVDTNYGPAGDRLPSGAFAATISGELVAGPQSAALDDGGNLYVLTTATGQSGYRVGKFDADGLPVTGFDANVSGTGRVASGLVASGGRLFVAGQRLGDFEVAAVNATTGVRDFTFGTSGIFSYTAAFGTGFVAQTGAIQVRSGGSSLMAAAVGTSGSFAQARVVGLTSAGAVDSSFNSGLPLNIAQQPAGQLQGYPVLDAAIGGSLVGVASTVQLDTVFSTPVALTGTVARVTGAGELDTTFGSNGVQVLENVAGGLPGDVTAVDVNADGRVVAAFTLPGPQGGNRFGIAVYNRQGELTATQTFGGNGLFRELRHIAGVVEVSPSRYLVIFSAYYSGDSTDFPGVVVAAINPATAGLDTAFGDGGYVFLLPVGDFDYDLRTVLKQSDGRILVGGRAGDVRAIFRLLPNGALDTTFASGGVFQVFEGETATYRSIVAAEAGGIYAVAGVTDSGVESVVVDRIFSDGTVDSLFGTSGRVVVPAPPGASELRAGAGLQLTDVSLYVGAVARTASGLEPLLVRLDAVTGAFDTGFGVGGYLSLAATSPEAAVTRLVADRRGGSAANRGVLIAGSSNDQPRLWRVTADGGLDTSYGGANSFAGQTGVYRGIVLDEASRPMPFGRATSRPGPPQVGLVERRRSLLNVGPKVIERRTVPRPQVGATFGEVKLTLRAPVGLRIDENSLDAALTYTAPGGGGALSASLEAVETLDSRTVRATYRYTRPGGGAFTSADGGNYTFTLKGGSQPDALRDDGGNTLPASITFTLALNFSGKPGPGDIDATFGDGGAFVIGASLSPGRVVDTLALADGSTLLLSNFASPVAFTYPGISAGLAVTKLLPSGSLDTSFGLQGRAFFNYRSGVEAVALLRDSAGRLIVVGNAFDGNTVIDETEHQAKSDVLVVRFTASGSLDETFGTGGSVVLDVSSRGNSDFVAGGVIRSNDGVLIYGETSSPDRNGTVVNGNGLFVLSLSEVGSVDAGYGDAALRLTSGAVFFAGPSFDFFIPYYGPRTAATSGGSLYIAGYQLFNNANTTRVFAVADDGLPLIGGTYFTAVHSDLQATTARLLADTSSGSLLLAQVLTNGDLSVARLNTDLTRDFGFGPADGRFLHNVNGNFGSLVFASADLTLDAAGRIYVAGVHDVLSNPPGNRQQVAVFSITSAGVVNASFANGSTQFDPGVNSLGVSVSFGNGLAVGVARDFGAPGFGSSRTVVLRYTASGGFDGTFDNGTLGAGRVVPANASNAAPAGTQALSYDAVTGEAFVVTVFRDDDGTEGLSYRRIVESSAFSPITSHVFAAFRNYRLLGLFARPGGGHVLAMSVTDALTNDATRLVLVRFSADGTLDTGFGNDGALRPVFTSNPASVDMRAAVVTDQTDRLLLVGSVDGTPAFLVVTLDGAVVLEPQLVTAYNDATTYQAVTRDPLGGGYYLALQESADFGRDPLGGAQTTRAVIERRTAAFALDASFGTSGVVRLTADPDAPTTLPMALLVDADRGRLLVAGSYGDGSRGGLTSAGFLLALDANTGAEVAEFSRTLLLPRTTIGSFNAIALDSDGHYLLAGAVDGLPRLVKVFAAGGFDDNYGQLTLPRDSILGRYDGLVLDRFDRPLAWGFEVQNSGVPQPGVLRRFVASTFAPPSATFDGLAPANLPFEPSGGYTVQLTYVATPGREIDLSSIVAGNVRLLINGVESGTVTLVSVSSQDPRIVTAVYRIAPPGGVFNFAGQGTYELRRSATSPVRDDLGQAVASGVITSFNLQFFPVGVSFVTPALPAAGTSELLFDVIYTPGSGQTLDLTTLGNGNIVVDGPGGASLAVTLVGSTSGPGGSRVATYRLAAPGGTFDPADNGTYVFRIGPSPVRDTRNTPPDPGLTTLGSLTLAYGNPTASLLVAPQPNFGDLVATFTVRFAAPTGRTISLASINGGEIRVTRPDGSEVFATVVSATVVGGSGGREVDVVYQFAPTQSPFAFAAQGVYVLRTVEGSASDDSGRPLPGATLATLTLAYPRPTASSTPPPTPSPGDPHVTFTVTFTPATGRTLALASVGNASVRVNRPDGGSVFATLLGTTTLDNGSVVGTFRFAPASGAFDASAAGTYTVVVPEGGVTDTRGVPVALTTLFTFSFAGVGEPGELLTVSIAPGTYPPGSPLFPEVVVRNPLSTLASQPFALRFFLVSGSELLLLGDVAIDPLAPGQTRTLLLGGRVSLPSASQLPPGVYGLAARVVSADGTPGPLVNAAQSLIIAARRPVRPGTLDPDFGDGSGVVTSFVPGPRLTLVGLVPQPGGRVVAGGYNDTGDFVLLRFQPDGRPDASFGDGGVIVFDVSGGFDLATTFVADAQGRLLLGGTSVTGDSTRFAVVRFNADGTLDTSFASAGVLLYTPPGAQAARLRGIQADRFGRPYLLGSVLAPLTTGGAVASHGVVIRLTPLGTVDASFGNRGVVSAAQLSGRPGTLPLTEGQSELTSLLLLRDRIVVGGHSGDADGTHSRFVLAGLSYDGRLDRRFGRGGLLATIPTTDAGPTLDRITALLVGPGGAIYVGGSRGTPSGTSAVVFRVTSGGRIDRAFSRGEPRRLNTDSPFETVSSLKLSVNNTVLVTVATAASLAAALAGEVGTVAFRLTPAGGNDPTFNGGDPLTVFDLAGPLVPASASAIVGDFDAFVQSRQGATAVVEGGRVRSIATTPVTGGTAVSLAQLSPDGADLQVLLTANLADLVRTGQRATAVLTLSNIGSLTAAGRFSLRLIADRADGEDVQLVLRNLSTRIPPGASRNLRLPFAFPRTTPTSAYVLEATVTPLTFTDINPANNRIARPGEFVVTPTGTLLAGTAPADVALRSVTPAGSATASLFGQQPFGEPGDPDGRDPAGPIN